MECVQGVELKPLRGLWLKETEDLRCSSTGASREWEKDILDIDSEMFVELGSMGMGWGAGAGAEGWGPHQ